MSVCQSVITLINPWARQLDLGVSCHRGDRFWDMPSKCPVSGQCRGGVGWDQRRSDRVQISRLATWCHGHNLEVRNWTRKPDIHIWTWDLEEPRVAGWVGPGGAASATHVICYTRESFGEKKKVSTRSEGVWLTLFLSWETPPIEENGECICVRVTDVAGWWHRLCLLSKNI